MSQYSPDSVSSKNIARIVPQYLLEHGQCAILMAFLLNSNMMILRISTNELKLNLTHQDLALNQTQSVKSGYSILAERMEIMLETRSYEWKRNFAMLLEPILYLPYFTNHKAHCKSFFFFSKIFILRLTRRCD